MAKRFTDTDKWKKTLLKSMPAAYKLLWLYMCDDCDHAGIWNVDLQIASLRIGEDVSEDEAIKVFGEKIVVFDAGTKWFIPGFIEFQYGELNEKNRVHESIIKILSKYNLLKNKPLTSPLQGAKDKYKDKVMDKEEVVKAQIFPTMPLPKDCGELPDVTAGSCVELIFFTKSLKVSVDQVKGLWPVFLVGNVTGKKYYADVESVRSHFMNWIKTQKFEAISAMMAQSKLGLSAREKRDQQMLNELNK